MNIKPVFCSHILVYVSMICIAFILAFPFVSFADVPVSTGSNAFLESSFEIDSLQSETNGLDNTALYELVNISTDIRSCLIILIVVPLSLFICYLIFRPLFWFL